MRFSLGRWGDLAHRGHEHKRQKRVLNPGLCDSKPKALSKRTSGPWRKGNLSKQSISTSSPTTIWNITKLNHRPTQHVGQKDKALCPIQVLSVKTPLPVWDCSSCGGLCAVFWTAQTSYVKASNLGRYSLSEGCQCWPGIQVAGCEEWGWGNPRAPEDDPSKALGGWRPGTRLVEMGSLQLWEIPALFSVSIKGSSQCDFWRPGCWPALCEVVLRGWTLWVIFLGLLFLGGDGATLCITWLHSPKRSSLLLIHSFTYSFILPARHWGYCVARQSMASALPGSVKWQEIWGRWTRALLLALAFTTRMIRWSYLFLDPLNCSSLGCQICVMMPSFCDLKEWNGLIKLMQKPSRSYQFWLWLWIMSLWHFSTQGFFSAWPVFIVPESGWNLLRQQALTILIDLLRIISLLLFKY